MLEPQRPPGRDSRNFPTRGEEGGGASAAGEGRAGGRDAPRPAPGLSACGARSARVLGRLPSLRRAAPPTPTPARPGSRTMREADPPAAPRPPQAPTLPTRAARPGGRSRGLSRSTWPAEALGRSLSSGAGPSGARWGASGRRPRLGPARGGAAPHGEPGNAAPRLAVGRRRARTGPGPRPSRRRLTSTCS